MLPLRAIPSSVRNRLERVRKTSAALATLSLALVALTGCAAAPAFGGATCDRAAATSGIDDIATITGEVGEKPEVELFTPIGAQKSSFSDVVVGTGPALTSPMQSAVLEFALYSGKTGSPSQAPPSRRTRRSLSASITGRSGCPPSARHWNARRKVLACSR